MSANLQTIRRWWIGLSILNGLMLVHLGYYFMLPDKGNSVLFRLLALLTVGVGGSVIGVAFWLNSARLEQLRHIARRVHWPFVFGGILLQFAFSLLSRPEWFYAQLAMTLAASLTVVYWSLYDHAAPITHKRWWFMIGGITVVLISVIRISGLTVYPALHAVDEPWTLGWVINYLETGELGDWIMVGREHNPVRFYVPMAEWLRIIGLGFWEARLFFYLLTFLVSLFTALAARNLYGDSTAFFTTLALISSTVLMLGARIRHDIGLSLSIALSLWLYSAALKRKWPLWHLFAGSTMGFGLFAHYHAAPLGLAMLIGLYVPRHIFRSKTGKHFPEIGLLLYGVGGLLAAMLVILIQGLPSETSQYLGDSVQRSLSAVQLIGATAQHVVNISHVSQVEFLLIGLGMVTICWRRQANDWTLLALLFSTHIALGFASGGGGFEYYLVPLVPLYGILIGSFFGRGLTRDKPTNTHVTDYKLKRGVVIAAIFFLTTSLGGTLSTPLRYLVWGKPAHKIPAVSQWIRDHTDSNVIIAGDHYYFLWLTDYHYISPLAPNLMDSDRRTRYASLEDVWDSFGVDVFIVDVNRSSYPLLQPLVQADYFESRGYTQVASFGTTSIYQHSRLAEDVLRQ